MYQVSVYHHTKDIVKGDLEDKLELMYTLSYTTKKAAKAYIEDKLRGKPARQVTRYPHTGDNPSNYYYFTGMIWQHENTGERMEEYYQYTLKKINPK